MKNKKGFTLIELLATLTILAIILMIAVPSITGVSETSKKSTIKSDAETFESLVKYKIMKDTSIEIPGDAIFTLNSIDKDKLSGKYDENISYVRVSDCNFVNNDYKCNKYEVYLYPKEETKSNYMYENKPPKEYVRKDEIGYSKYFTEKQYKELKENKKNYEITQNIDDINKLVKNNIIKKDNDNQKYYLDFIASNETFNYKISYVLPEKKDNNIDYNVYVYYVSKNYGLGLVYNVKDDKYYLKEEIDLIKEDYNNFKRYIEDSKNHTIKSPITKDVFEECKLAQRNPCNNRFLLEYSSATANVTESDGTISKIVIKLNYNGQNYTCENGECK